MSSRHRTVVSGSVGVAFAVALASACSGTVDIGGFDPADGGRTDASASGDSGDSSPVPTGPMVEVRLRATQTKVDVAAGTAGQTPITQSLAIVSLLLYTGPTDTTPLVVFDAKATTANGVECSVSDKADTAIAKVPIASLKSGKYVRARIGVAWVKWKVNGRAHVGGLKFDGTYETVQVLSKGASIEGSVRDPGYFKTTFVTAGQAPVSNEGTQALPIPPQSGIVKFVNEGSQAFYEFPVDLTVDLGVTKDLASVFEVNTYENYRWTDQEIAGYEPGVWDTSGTTYEPVVSFGVNSAKLSFEQK